MVLKKPVVSFGHCSSDTPASLLIGSETTVDIRTENISPYDIPLDVSLAFTPSMDSKTKRAKGWEKSLQLNTQDKQLNFRVNAPGEYKILGVKGKVRMLNRHDIGYIYFYRFFSIVPELFRLPIFAGSSKSPGHLLKSNGRTYRTGR